MRKYVLSWSLCLAPLTPALAQGDADRPFRDYDAGSYAEALDGARAALRDDPRNPVWWALVAEAEAQLQQHQAAADAFGQAAAFEPYAARRSYFLRAQAMQLVNAGRREAARGVVKQALAEPVLAAADSLDWAMVAISAGDDLSAQEILANEDLYPSFDRQTALDAAYSARRAGLDARAARFFAFGLTLDTAASQPLPQAQVEAIRREIRELERRWSLLAVASYSTAASPLGLGTPAFDATEAFQTGAEAAWRIGGWRSGRPVHVFARVFHTETPGGSHTGGNATQGWLGVRYKPLAALNLNLEASRTIALDPDGRDDWSMRAAISGGRGLEPSTDRRGWIYGHYYADLSFLLESDLFYGTAETRGGYSLRLDKRATTLTPYATARLGLDTGRAQAHDLGAGVGLSLRHWYAETRNVAYRGFIDLDIQARQGITGDGRASGVQATLTLGR